jgi:hypothetical protein
MKKIYINLLGAIAFSCISTSSIFTLPTKIFLQNNYGQPIEYIEEIRYEAGTEGDKSAPKILGNGGSVQVADPKKVGPHVFAWRDYLYIRTLNGKYWDISYAYDQIVKEQRDHPHEDPFIMIQPGINMYGGWKVHIDWHEDLHLRKLQKKAGQVEVTL